jgi:hypothetical protein
MPLNNSWATLRALISPIASEYDIADDEISSILYW